MAIVYWSRSNGVMSGPGDIRLPWESRALSFATSGGGGGGRHAIISVMFDVMTCFLSSWNIFDTLFKRTFCIFDVMT